MLLLGKLKRSKGEPGQNMRQLDTTSTLDKTAVSCYWSEFPVHTKKKRLSD